ncbi:hypothetical protein LZC95_27960 [Pendulispora brunnea]|uniref:Uncharacterized protein n=1 Tax=Pendulispora brunnea TaxID=2905690 RepID=A0ABZ2JV00_9BACT
MRRHFDAHRSVVPSWTGRRAPARAIRRSGMRMNLWMAAIAITFLAVVSFSIGGGGDHADKIPRSLPVVVSHGQRRLAHAEFARGGRQVAVPCNGRPCPATSVGLTVR